jgi:hypothetical protein
MKRIKQKNILTRSVHSLTDREDKEFAHTRDNMRYLNSSQRGAPLVSLFGMCLSGALSVGAMKVIEKLAMIKYPTPPTEDNPCGTLSYLPARAQWAELQILKIQRTIVDAGAIPLKSGIAVCSANAPRQSPTAHAVEAGEAGPAVFRKYLDRSLHLLTMDATSHSTIFNPVTVSHDRTQPLTTANFSTVFHDSVRPPSKNSGHCLENDAGSQLEDAG